MGPSRADRRRSHTSRLTLIPEVEKLRSRTNQRGPNPFPFHYTLIQSRSYIHCFHLEA